MQTLPKMVCAEHPSSDNIGGQILLLAWTALHCMGGTRLLGAWYYVAAVVTASSNVWKKILVLNYREVFPLFFQPIILLSGQCWHPAGILIFYNTLSSCKSTTLQ